MSFCPVYLIKILLISCTAGYQRTTTDDLSLSPRHNWMLAQRIVDEHNQVRAKVIPYAGNMLKMEWSGEAAQQAQQWADQCRGGHNHKSQRRTRHSTCGQNLLRTFSGPFSWSDVLNIWSSDESRYYRYGQLGNNMDVVGHYVQMIWASTFQIGCAYRNCGHWQLYVCHYCPAGNTIGEEMFPYKSDSKTCTACPANCENNLCKNSCPYTNVYANCDHIVKHHNVCFKPTWSNACRASCNCQGKIY